MCGATCSPRAHAIRAIAREQPEIAFELSMRRDLVKALRALQRHEIDLAFGNVATLSEPLWSELTAEQVMSDTIAAIVQLAQPARRARPAHP
jgi:hypothetical protein